MAILDLQDMKVPQTANSKKDDGKKKKKHGFGLFGFSGLSLLLC